MPLEIITPKFEDVDRLSILIKALGDHPALNNANGPKYMYYTTQLDSDVAIDQGNLDLEAACAEICGHMLTVCETTTPLIEAKKFAIERWLSPAGKLTLTCEVERETGEVIHTLIIRDQRNMLMFKELGPVDKRHCDLTFIRF